jgi:hypothetical protein
LFEARVKQRVIQVKKSGFSAETAEAYEIPEDKRTPKQKELAEPLVKAVREIKLDKEMNSDEQQEERKLLDGIAKAVLALPEKDAPGFPFDGILERPTATVLGHLEPALVPEVYVLNRGTWDESKKK